LALIARDEEATLPRLLGSIEGAFDQLALLDTGSTDRTVEVFEEWARGQDLSLGYKVDHFEWCDDFAAARNAADALLDTDWLAWADCDDEIVGAKRLREVIDYTVSTEATWIKFQYVGDGVPYLRGRIFRRGHGTWRWPVHESKATEGWCIETLQGVCHWRHQRRARASSDQRNRRIARAWVEVEPEDARGLYIAAREELIRGGDRGRGLDYARRYLKLKRVRQELGPYRLAAAHRMLERLRMPGGNAVDLIALGLVDPTEWEARDKFERLGMLEAA
jgi:glycosyltransferase involved in cell wall biosynthesis